MSDNTASGIGKVAKPFGHIIALIAIFYISDFLLGKVINDGSSIRPVLYAAIAFFYFWILQTTVKRK